MNMTFAPIIITKTVGTHDLKVINSNSILSKRLINHENEYFLIYNYFII